MKTLFWCATIFVFSMLFSSVDPATARAEDAEEHVSEIQVGKLKVLAIDDINGTMGANILPDLDKFPILKTYFDNGPLPSVCRVYYLQDGQNKILVDSGWGSEQGKMGRTKAILQEHGIAPDSITDILLTHLDFDHIGGLVEQGKSVFPRATLHVSVPEWEAWQKGAILKRLPEKVKIAQALKEIYKGRISLFKFGEEVLPGIWAEDASGHTPGHTAFVIASDSDKLTIAGDVMHVGKVQLQKPELSSVYDMDAAQAARTRQHLLENAAQNGGQFAGMHFPMISPVRALPDGGFAMREPR